MKLRNAMEELEGQRNVCRTTLHRAVEAETQIKDMKERSSGLEGELWSSDVECDQLKEDRRKVKMLVCLWQPHVMIMFLSGYVYNEY